MPHPHLTLTRRPRSCSGELQRGCHEVDVGLGKYVVVSETTGRRFGTYDTREEAEKHLRQIEFFKHITRRRIERSRSR
jgi:hypothetical protein